jgi:phage terminase large subunit-like protein
LLGVVIDEKFLASKVKQARTLPGKLNSILRLNFCVWTEASAGAMDMARWDACREDPVVPAGAECFGGLDMSTTTDISAFLLLHEDAEGYINAKAWFWCPQEGIEVRSRRDRVPYALWAEQGYITPTPGNVVDYDRVRADIRDIAADHAIREIGYDRWNATQLVSQLMGDGAVMVPVGQGYVTLSGPMKDWLTRIATGKVRHGGNPVLRWMAANLVAEMDPAGNVKPSKARSTERIDGQAAAITAMSRLTAPRESASRPAILDLVAGMAGAAGTFRAEGPDPALGIAAGRPLYAHEVRR